MSYGIHLIGARYTDELQRRLDGLIADLRLAEEHGIIGRVSSAQLEDARGSRDVIRALIGELAGHRVDDGDDLLGTISAISRELERDAT